MRDSWPHIKLCYGIHSAELDRVYSFCRKTESNIRTCQDLDSSQAVLGKQFAAVHSCTQQSNLEHVRLDSSNIELLRQLAASSIRERGGAA